MLHEPAIVNGMLIVIAVTTLTFAYRNLRHYLRRSPAPAVVSRPRATPGVRPPPVPSCMRTTGLVRTRPPASCPDR
jgi:hypothetical protein